jgi:RHS repeat-associated protein
MPHLRFLRWDYKDQFYNTSNGTYSSFYSYDAQGNRTRKVIDKNNIIETIYYIDGFELYRREVNGAIDYERTTLNISDDEKVFVRVEKKTNEPEVVRYQYDNHLGSACLELDYTGRIISYEEYHPFGTTSYRSGRSETEVSLKRYKYCGKERDEQTGFYYYGMRYYAAWLCRFVSVDPMADEYLSLSPYAYCMNNPVKYIDTDGRKIVIFYQDPGEKNSQKLYYYKGFLYTDKRYTSQYIGDNQFARNVQSDLNDIASKGGKLQNRLNTLVNSLRTHEIKETSGENNMTFPNEALEGAKTGSTTYYNRDSENVRQSRSALVHELLGHGYSVDQGFMKEGAETRVGPTYLDQINAIDIQNVYNKEVGLPLRTTDGENRDIDVSKYLDLNPVNK